MAPKETFTPQLLLVAVLLLSVITFSGVIMVHTSWTKANTVAYVAASDSDSRDRVLTTVDKNVADIDLVTESAFTTTPTTAPLVTSPIAQHVVTAIDATTFFVRLTTNAPPTEPSIETPSPTPLASTVEVSTAGAALATTTLAASTEPLTTTATAATTTAAATTPATSHAPDPPALPTVLGPGEPGNVRRPLPPRFARPPLPTYATDEQQFVYLQPQQDAQTFPPPNPVSGHRMWVEIGIAPTTVDLEDGDAVSNYVSERFAHVAADMSHDIFRGQDPFANSTKASRPQVDLSSPYFNPPGLGTIVATQGHGPVAAEGITKYVYPAGAEFLDAVISHVDHNAPGWMDQMRRFLRPGQPIDQARFRDLGELQYCISGIVHHGGTFIRNIHVIVANESHIPAWLHRLRANDRNMHERIRIVTHNQIFPSDCPDGTQSCYLPTFSSCAIEATMHRIPDLSPYFIYFNNDMFLGRRLSLYDYFRPALSAVNVQQKRPVTHESDFVVPLVPRVLHSTAASIPTTNKHALAWLQGRFAPRGALLGFGLNAITGQGLGLTGDDAPRRLFIEFEPLVFSERKDLPNGCSPYSEDHGHKDGLFVCREKNPNFARQNSLRNAKVRHARCPHIVNSTRDPEEPTFKPNSERLSRNLLMPGPCFFATAEEYELASALYVALWKKLKVAESVPNVTRSSAEIDEIIREARMEARNIRGIKPMGDPTGAGARLGVRMNRYMGAKPPLKDDLYDFNIFYTVNKRRGWDNFGVFATHTFAHAARVMDRGALSDMLALLHPLTVDTRARRFRQSVDLFVPFLWELYAVADRRHRRARVKASQELLVPGTPRTVLVTKAPASLRVDLCHRNVSQQRRLVFSPIVNPVSYEAWPIDCVDVENDIVAQLRPLGPVLPANLLQASINIPSKPPNAFGVTWTQGSTNYATEKLVSEFFVMNLKPMYYFAMVGNRFEVKKYRNELSRQVTAFITVNDNFRSVDALTLTTIQEMFLVIIGDAPLLGLE